MFNVIGIIKNNNATFYNFDTGDTKNQWPRIAVIILFSIILSAFFSGDLKPFLGGVLTVQAILVGFSFSVLFFLLSHKDRISKESPSIEDQIKAERLSNLSSELFYNVSYFNLIAIFSILTALSLLVPDMASPLGNKLQPIQIYFDLGPMESITPSVRIIFASLKYAIVFSMYFSLLESMFTFLRTTGRISYFFEKKLLFSKKSTEG